MVTGSFKVTLKVVHYAKWAALHNLVLNAKYGPVKSNCTLEFAKYLFKNNNILGFINPMWPAIQHLIHI